MKNTISDTYESLTLSERCDAMREARREAIDDAEFGEKWNPYDTSDPRYLAYEKAYAAE
jgi:hypothetical protein